MRFCLLSFGSSKQDNRHFVGMVKDSYSKPQPLSRLQFDGMWLNTVSCVGDLVAIGGRNVLKIITLRGHEYGDQQLKEDRNLRGRGTDAKTHANDVELNPHYNARNLLASGNTNSTVTIWDVENKKILTALKDHTRAVNRIAWSLLNENQLLSASQDSTVKLFDVISSKVVFSFSVKSEAREVHFDRYNQHMFACSTESGEIQVWDVRNNSKCLSSFQAHNGVCLALQYHPTIPHYVATGGRDCMVKVWDMRDTKYPIRTIQTGKGVGRIQWRPDHADEIASAAFVLDNSIHVWDIKRPHIPVISFEGLIDVASAILWVKDTPFGDAHTTNSYNRLLCCSASKSTSGYSELTLHSYNEARQPIHSMCTVGVSISPHGDVASVGDRISREDPLISPNVPGFLIQREILATSSDSFPSSPPFAFNEYTPSLFNINATVHVTKSTLESKSALQSAVFYENELGFDARIIKHFAQNYKLQGDSLPALCAYNAQVARDVEMFQVAQSWETVALLYTPLESNTFYHRFNDNNASESFIFSKLNRQESVESVVSAIFNFSNSSDSATDIKNIEASSNTVNPNSVTTGSTNPSVSTFDVESNNNGEICLIDDSIAAHSHIGVSGLEDWLKDEAITDLLDFYSDIGDVQTCIAFITVLKDIYLPPSISHSQIYQWMLNYIDVLHRLQMFSYAADLIKTSSLTEIKQMSLMSTTCNSSCFNCKKSLNAVGGGTRCNKCMAMYSKCAICEMPVKGLYIWCQGCSHGGHLLCLEEWFASNSVCPTGCRYK